MQEHENATTTTDDDIRGLSNNSVATEPAAQSHSRNVQNIDVPQSGANKTVSADASAQYTENHAALSSAAVHLPQQQSGEQIYNNLVTNTDSQQKMQETTAAAQSVPIDYESNNPSLANATPQSSQIRQHTSEMQQDGVGYHQPVQNNVINTQQHQQPQQNANISSTMNPEGNEPTLNFQEQQHPTFQSRPDGLDSGQAQNVNLPQEQLNEREPKKDAKPQSKARKGRFTVVPIPSNGNSPNSSGSRKNNSDAATKQEDNQAVPNTVFVDNSERMNAFELNVYGAELNEPQVTNNVEDGATQAVANVPSQRFIVTPYIPNDTQMDNSPSEEPLKTIVDNNIPLPQPQQVIFTQESTMPNTLQTVVSVPSHPMPVVSVTNQMTNTITNTGDEMIQQQNTSMVMTQVPITQTAYITSQDVTYAQPTVATASPATIVGMVGNTPIVRMQETTGLVSKKKGRFKLLQPVSDDQNLAASSPDRSQVNVVDNTNNNAEASNNNYNANPSNAVSGAGTHESTEVAAHANVPPVQRKRKGRFVITTVSQASNNEVECVENTSNIPHQIPVNNSPSSHTFVVAPSHIVSPQVIYTTAPIANLQNQPPNTVLQFQEPMDYSRSQQVNNSPNRFVENPNSGNGRPPKAPQMNRTNNSQPQTVKFSDDPDGRSNVPQSSNDNSASQTTTNGKDAAKRQSQASKDRKSTSVPGFIRQNYATNSGYAGLGKVFHYIDQMRSEVTEADRILKSLYVDMKCLKEKNKELEARARGFEKKYTAEKALREAAEHKVKALKKKLRYLKPTAAEGTKKTESSDQAEPTRQDTDNIAEVVTGGIDTSTATKSSDDECNQRPVDSTTNQVFPSDMDKSRLSNADNVKSPPSDQAEADKQASAISSNQTNVESNSKHLSKSNSNCSMQQDFRLDAPNSSGNSSNNDFFNDTQMEAAVQEQSRDVFDPFNTSENNWTLNTTTDSNNVQHQHQHHTQHQYGQQTTTLQNTPFYMMDMYNNSPTMVPVYELDTTSVPHLMQLSPSRNMSLSNTQNNDTQSQVSTMEVQQPMFVLSQQSLDSSQNGTPNSYMTIQQPLLQLQKSDGSASYTFHTPHYVSTPVEPAEHIGFYAPPPYINQGSQQGDQVDLLSSDVPSISRSTSSLNGDVASNSDEPDPFSSFVVKNEAS